VSRAERIILWFAVAVILVVSCENIRLILDLDGEFTRVRLGDSTGSTRLRFADFAAEIPNSPVGVVSRYRWAFTGLAFGIPFAALASTRMRGWRRDGVLMLCMCLAIGFLFYVNRVIAIAS
jgi:hypothetical protein